VLIEATNWSARQAMAQTLAQAGFRPIACPGPVGSDTRCTLAAGAGCPAAEQADVVVHALQPGDPRNREVLAALRRRLPGTPVIVEVPEPVARSRPEAYEGCVVIPAPMSAAVLVEAVRNATT
jgi:hypothetical protein